MKENKTRVADFLKSHSLKIAVLLSVVLSLVSITVPLCITRFESLRALVVFLGRKLLNRPMTLRRLPYLTSFRYIACCITVSLFLASLLLFCLWRNKFENSDKLQKLAIAITGTFAAMFVLLALDGGHNWGGDFSEYIAQARAIVTGTIDEQVKNNSYIIGNSTPLGDIVYPWGFPLMLTPFYALSGKSLFFLKLPVMLCFSVSAIFCALLFRKHFSFFQAELLTLFVVANPVTILFCNQVLSDIPFMCLSLVTLYFFDGLFYTTDKKRQTVFGFCSGVFSFLAFMTRTNGIVFPCLLAALHILHLLSKSNRIKSTMSKLNFKEFASLNLTAHLLPYFLFALLCIIQNLFLPKAGMTHLSLYFPISPTKTIKNALYYCQVFRDFFPFRRSISILFYAYFAPLFIYGLVRHIFRLPILSIYLFGTMGILLFAPFTGGIRYVFSAIPVMIVFAGYGARELMDNLVNKDKPMRFAVFLEIVSVLACIQIYSASSKGMDEYGAYSVDAKEMYAAIETETEKNNKIIFFKPRVLYLETDRLGFQTANIERLSDADYLLLSKDGYGTFDYDIEKQYPVESGSLQKILENDTMKLYKIISKEQELSRE
ncbi:MAG: glycosyltransferase family 39 protein [Treponemataceae bacterium]|nr:glycosyltransferase family 39 protein [Treponemataceae bacterium]